MKVSAYIIISALIFTITGCETDVNDVKVPEFEQKLVISGFISPSDSISYISVKSNRGIYDNVNRNLPVGKLTGTLSDGMDSVLLESDSSGLVFNHRKMKIEYGKTYSLTVLSDRGLRAEATCSVPQKRNFTIEADTFSVQQNFEWPGIPRIMDLRITIKDIAGEENYYRLEVTARGYSSGYFNHWTSQRLSVSDYLISDRKLDGEDLVRNTNSGINYFMDFDASFVTVYLYNTEKSYYLYERSLQNYHKFRGPFAEPTPVFSNIKGGLGIFTSYTLDSAVFRIR